MRTLRHAGSSSTSMTLRASLTTLNSAVKEFIAEHLPEFEGAGVVVAFTGSAGIKGTRVRLIFELEEPRSLAAQLAFVDFGDSARRRQRF